MGAPFKLIFVIGGGKSTSVYEVSTVAQPVPLTKIEPHTTVTTQPKESKKKLKE